MAQIRIPCLVGKTNKAKITSWYWQPSKTLAAAGWKPLTLGKDEGAAIAAARAINLEVEAWKAGGKLPLDRKVKPRRQPGTLAALIARYRREVIDGSKPNGQPMLRPKTIEAYDIALRRLEQWAGDKPLAFITPARVRILKETVARPVDKDNPDKGGIGHASAFNLLRMGRQLFAFAETIDLTPRGSNPFTDFGLGQPPPRRGVWELQHDAAFDAAARDLGLPGLALARELALYCAQRQGDLLRFTEADLVEIPILDETVRKAFADKDGKVRGWQVVQAKTSTDYVSVELAIPFEPELLARIDATLRANRARDRSPARPEDRRLLSYVLVDDRTGLPWKQRAFIQACRKVLDHAAKKARLPEMAKLVWHDLRRTRVVRLRRKGFSVAQIASITGHDPKSVDMMLRVYGPVDPQMTAATLAAAIQQEKVA